MDLIFVNRSWFFSLGEEVKKNKKQTMLCCQFVLWLQTGEFQFLCAFPLPRTKLVKSYFVDSIANALRVLSLSV